VGRWRGWRGQRTGRRGRRRAFRRIALVRGARAKSGLRRQGQGSRSRGEGRAPAQEGTPRVPRDLASYSVSNVGEAGELNAFLPCPSDMGSINSTWLDRLGLTH
jgi:hypothetical protein